MAFPESASQHDASARDLAGASGWEAAEPRPVILEFPSVGRQEGV